MTDILGGWRKSTRSVANGQCVEVADLPFGGKAIRDAKHGDESPILRFTLTEWEAFVSGVKDGEFD